MYFFPSISVLFTNTLFQAFRYAYQFNADVSSWDVRFVVSMVKMFEGATAFDHAASLCGFYWMSSATAQSAFGLFPDDVDGVPDIAIDGDGDICHCPQGTSYQGRIKPTGNPNQYPPPRLESCIPCSDGTYSDGGSRDEAVCTTCEELQGDEYCAQGKRAACPSEPGLACHQGNVVPSLGSYLDDFGEVQPCSMGYFCPGDLIRVACSAGTYADAASSTACTPCPVGQISAVEGSISCETCEVGTYESDNMCVPCDELGYHCEDGQIVGTLFGAYLDNDGTLQPCTPGYFCAGGNRNACEPGKYTDAASATSCFPCQKGEVASYHGMTSCETCPPGKYELNGITCALCESGFRSETEGSITCTLCEPGKFTQFEGETTCENCPMRGVNCFDRAGGTPVLETGFWRFDDSLQVLPTTEFYSCEACNVDAQNYSFTCREGHRRDTPVCGSCLEGYWMNNGVCTSW